MTDIASFPFKKENFNEIKEYRFGTNWPSVYVIENNKEAYIGQSVNVYNRSKEHFKNPERQYLSNIHVITDNEYNVSAALDIESWLIQYMAADGKFVLQNGNSGLQNHDYYDRQKYQSKFENVIWEQLKKYGLVANDLKTLKNSDLFKYSPYKTLTQEQYDAAHEIFEDIVSQNFKTYIINGKPGTGKTILAVYLFKYLSEQEKTKDLKVALVVPMTSLRKTIRKVFKNIKGLKSSMVIAPGDVIKDSYDLLIVDEAHRLRRRVNITNFKSFDDTNKQLGFEDGDELDWILASAKISILFYDENQSVRPSDVRKEKFGELNAKHYTLKSQMRVKGGQEYIDFITSIFDLTPIKTVTFKDYDFQVYENLQTMADDLKKKDEVHGLARMVAGYAWPWHTKKGSKEYDIEIDGLKFIWNSTAQDWVNSKNAVNEVGCIHTVQGYDLNYVGVIIGPELAYDPVNHKLVVYKEKYFDINGRRGVTDPAELAGYIVNIYKTLLTRGIKGTYLYIVDKNLREYIKSKV